MRKLLFPCLAVLCLWTACQQELPSDIPEAKTAVTVTKSFHLSPQEAKEVVSQFLDAQTVATRGGAKRLISHVDVLSKTGMATRSAVAAQDTNLANIDTLLYVVNFANNGGYAIVSADKRTYPILAIMDEGNYSFSKLPEEDNPGFLYFLENALDYQKRSIEAHANTRATIITQPGWEVLESVPKKLVVNWHQHEPYNIFVPHVEPYEPGPTGCVITACVQACSYFEQPKELKWDSYGTPVHWTYDWERIKRQSQSNGGQLSRGVHEHSVGEVASLMSFVGLKVGAKYSSNGTGAKSNDLRKLILREGWFNCAPFRDYKAYKLVEELRKNNHLIYMEGYSRKKQFLFFKWYKDGHAWLIDGFLRCKHNGKDETLFHCNWGWGENYNGYCYAGVFDSDEQPFKDVPVQTPPTDNYKYKLEYMTLYK